MTTGLIFNLQRFSLHDGPGIRTTIFFKGCPLKCAWCQNPEGIGSDVELFRYSHKCIKCGACCLQCSEKAITLNDQGPQVDRHICNRCMKCAEFCPSGALENVGKVVSIDEVVQIALRDRILFEESGGGVTISGGEPLMQPDFLLGLLEAFQRLNIHRAIETCGYSKWEVINKISKNVDLLYYDFKLYDEQASKDYTGVSNSLILENLERLVDNGINVRVRMPLIPTVNDDAYNIERTAEYLSSIGVINIELLPYNNLGTAKYAGLDLNCPFQTKPVLTTEYLEQASSIFKNNGILMTSEV